MYLVEKVLESETIPKRGLLNVAPLQNNVHCSLGKSIFLIRHVKVNVIFVRLAYAIVF